GFFLRVGIIGLATLCLFGLLALRLWSLQVVRGPHFALAAQRQTYRLIDLPAPRGQIVDSQGRVLAGTNGGLAVSVDSSVLGVISPTQLAAHSYSGLRAGAIVGQSGAEAAYDRLLNGGLDKARVVVDAQGRPIGPARVVRVARPASGLQLTIDLRLQRAAEKAIQDGIALAHANGHYDAHSGAAVVMNPRDGSVYALASYPRFDQARAATNPEYLRALLNPNDPRHLLVNRATQGMYPTGPTFKPIVAEAGLASGLIGPYSTLPCTSTFTVGNHVFHNVEASVNASLTLPQALSISCDTWFYRLGAMFYGEQQRGHLYMQDWARRLGVGHPTGFDVPGEAAG